jgi:uncharacterized membrane protein YdjX (TVP38/TMEM64 family)
VRADRDIFLERHGPLLLTVSAMVLVIVAFFVIAPLRHCISYTLGGNLGGLRQYIRSLHFDGFVLLSVLILCHSVIPYPSEILTTTAGYVYGFWPGLAFSIIGWTVTAALTYGIGRTVGRPLLHALLGKRFSDLERAMDRGGVELLIIWRFLPVVPYSLLGYAVGATRRSLWTLEWTSFVGYLPLTTAVAYLGSQAKSLSASNPLLWIALVFVIVLLVGSRFFARRLTKPAGGPAT